MLDKKLAMLSTSDIRHDLIEDNKITNTWASQAFRNLIELGFRVVVVSSRKGINETLDKCWASLMDPKDIFFDPVDLKEAWHKAFTHLGLIYPTEATYQNDEGETKAIPITHESYRSAAAQQGIYVGYWSQDLDMNFEKEPLETDHG